MINITRVINQKIQRTNSSKLHDHDRHQTISIPPNQCLIQRWEAQERVKEETGVRVISLRRNASKQES